MNEASKALLLNTVKEWNKFAAERERMKTIAMEVAAITQRVVLESINFLKSQQIDVQCETVTNMKIMGHPVVIEPIVDAVFPNVKTKVNMTCSGATRAIIINSNGSISAGGNPFLFDQFKKGIPDSFTTNSAEFVSDAFLFIARNQGQEQQKPAASGPAPAPAPIQQQKPPAPAPAAGLVQQPKPR